jgi:hypothetical protein
MGRWVRMSKRHPEIVMDNEACNVNELGQPQGNQIVQGQHFVQSSEPEAHGLATFLRTDVAIELSEADRLLKENIETRLRDGYAHVQYLNFRLSRPVYVGRWDAESKQFIMDVFSVVHSKHDREVQRFTDLTQACVLWVKYPSEHTVKELRAGANEVVDELRNEECCVFCGSYWQKIGSCAMTSEGI